MKRILFGLLAAILLSGPALAQGSAPAIVVTTCGTPAVTLHVGQAYSPTIDLNGILCAPGGAGGAITANQGTPAVVGNAWPVTLAIGGSLNAVGNAIFVAPGTGATWTLGAGAAIIGKVGIDQTTPGTTNGVQVNAALPAGGNTIGAVTQASGPWTSNITQVGGGTLALGQAAMVASVPVVIASNQSAIPVSFTPSVTVGLTPISTAALAANLVVKGSAGNLFSFVVSADSTLSAAAWWIMIYNATSAPVDGAVTPTKCYAMGSGTTGYAAAFPEPVQFSTGITIGVSTSGCFAKAASTHAFISGDFQ